jgi:transposase
VDWFFGFKLHLAVNEQGELLNAILTPGNVDDRQPVPQLLQQLFGKVFGDRGYVSQKLALQLWQDWGIQLITKLKRNMKNRLMTLADKRILRRRAIIESVIDQLKNISQPIAFSSPFTSQLKSQFALRIDCLLPPAKETIPHTRCLFA